MNVLATNLLGTATGQRPIRGAMTKSSQTYLLRVDPAFSLREKIPEIVLTKACS